MDISRKAWPPGPWDKEPDTDQWVDADTGYKCHARRGPMGAWCGYVELPADHPDAGVNYNDMEVQVHGGLTYSDGCMFGFDCAHWNDIAPVMLLLRPESYLTRNMGEEYRTLEYVRDQCKELARQFYERRHH